MTRRKKRIFTVLILAMFSLVFMFVVPKMISEAQENEHIYKTVDGTIFRLCYDKTQIDEPKIMEVVENHISDEQVYYGSIIKNNGVTEKVIAIADDGAFITEVIEDENE